MMAKDRLREDRSVSRRFVFPGLMFCYLALVSAYVSAFQPPAGAFPSQPEAAASRLMIEVVDGDWGTARPADVRQLLASVATTLIRHVGLPQGQRFHLVVRPRPGSPRVLYERGLDGEYFVHLSSRDRHWYQYAYQFSHELCHILSNFDHKERTDQGKVAEDNQWFEEALCETASLFTLQRLSEEWRQQPPSRNWLGYERVFADYAEFLLAQPHRRLLGAGALERWYEDNRDSLSENPYLRKRNEVVATRLLALFQEHPHYWRSLRYLNRDRSSAGKSFEAYLADWRAACPEAARPLVDRARSLFGFSASSASAATDAAYDVSLLRP